MLSEDDIAKVAEALEPNSSAAVLVWEKSLGGAVAVGVRHPVASSSRAVESRLRLIAASEDDESEES